MNTAKILIVTTFLAGTTVAMAVDEAATPVVIDATHESMAATVEAIDHQQRMVTLKGPDGNMLTMQAGPEITRLEEIKQGDRVKVDYLESVAVTLAPSGQAGAPVATEESFLVRNPKSQKPGATAVQTDVITATVEKIDIKERIATLQGPGGDTMEVNVAPDVPNLQNIKPGDQVIVEKTRALALNIEE